MNAIMTWWAGGELMMPVMLLVSCVLYYVLGERAYRLFNYSCDTNSRDSCDTNNRRDEMVGAVQAGATGARDLAYRAWLAQYVAISEETELTRGFHLIRVLTACLPLLGLLGTVSGMVLTFAALAAHQGVAGAASASVHEASAGIGLALTTTQYGIALAIPSLLVEWILRRRVAAISRARGRAGDGMPSTDIHLDAS